MVELIGVVVEEAGETRLNRCSFAVRAGEIVGLAGGSGSGKSTALQVAAGLIAPTRGRLVLDGRDVTRKPGRLRSACGLAERNPPGPDDLTIDAWMALWAGLDGVGRRGRADDERGSPTRDKAIREALERFPETIFVCDESYLDFHPQGLSALSFKPFPDNLVVLRSFSKVYRVPGLRLGFCAAGKFLLEALWKMYLPWSVNRLAQLAGPWLLEQEAYVDKVRRFVQEERGYFLPLLKALPGVEVFPGEIHFFLLKLKFHQAGKVWETLLKEHKILVRNAANFFGLGANFLRLALRGREENKRLLKALEEVLS